MAIDDYWRKNSSLNEPISEKFKKNIYVFRDSVLCLGGNARVSCTTGIVKLNLRTEGKFLAKQDSRNLWKCDNTSWPDQKF